MTLNQLRYFCEVCKWNNISKAAEQLYVSQPSISVAVRKLEEEFGVPLFVRNNNRLTLSRSGQILWDSAREILKLADRLPARMNEDTSRSHEIKIGISPEISQWIMDKLEEPLKKLKNKYPDLHIVMKEISPAVIDNAWDDSHIDLLFCSLYAPLPAHLSAKRIYSTEQKICMSKNHPLAGKDTVSFKDLENEFLIQNFYPDGAFARKIQKLCDEAGVTLMYPYFFIQVKTIKELIKQNKALCFSRPELTGIEGEDIVALPLTEQFLSNVSIIYSNRTPLQNEIADFINLIPASAV